MGRQPAGRSGAEDELKARARAWAERWCLVQELPFTITDRQALAQIAELMGLPGQSRKKGRRRDSSKRL
jgi:predicted ATPase